MKSTYLFFASLVTSFFAATAFAELPDRFVEYVESTNTATYVNTGIEANPQTTRIIVTLAPTVLTKNTAFFGSRPEAKDGNSTYITLNGSKQFNFNGTGDNLSAFVPTANDIYTLELYRLRGVAVNQNGSQVFDGKRGNTNNRTDAKQKQIYLFACNDYDTAVYPGALQKFYSAAIYTNDTVLAGYYVPCVKNGTAAIYDAVTETILYPVGTPLTAPAADNPMMHVNNGVAEAMIRITSSAGGSFEGDAERWVAVGSDVTLTALPGEGMAALWTTDHEPSTVPLSYGGSAFSFKMPAKGVNVNLSFESADYAPKVSDFSALIDAAEAGDEIRLAEGTYYLSQEIAVNKAIKISGAGQDKTFIKPVPGKNIRAINMTAPACIKNFTITGFTNQFQGCAIYMTQGTADTIRVTLNNQYNYNLKEGTGIYMSGGVVTNSLIDRQIITTDQNNYGGLSGGVGIYASGGVIIDSIIRENARIRTQEKGNGLYLVSGAKVVRCLIANNDPKQPGDGDYNSSQGSGIYAGGANVLVDQCVIVSNGWQGVYLANGEVRNSLIYGHKSTATSRVTGIKQTGGRLYNCTITGNESANSYAGLEMTGGIAVNNIIYANGTLGDLLITGGTFNTNLIESLNGVSIATVGNLTSDPKFIDPANGNFRIDYTSPAFEAGAPLESVTCDLDSVSRPKEASYDIGCYEYELSGSGEFLCSISVPVTKFAYGSVPTATVRVVGATGASTYKWYLDGVLTDQTDAVARFPGLNIGDYTLKVEVTNGGTTKSDEAIGAFTISPTTVYVSRNGGNKHPYDTPEKAAHTLVDAWEALWQEAGVKSTVIMDEGTYVATKEFICNSPVEFIGAGIDKTVISGGPLQYVGRGFDIKAAGVVLKGFTITGYTNNVGGTAIRMTGKSTITDVRIAYNCVRNSNGGGSLSKGGGINMSAGIVTNCLIDNNFADSSYGTYDGVGIYMSGGLVIDSEIAYNLRNRNQVTGVGVGISGGTLRNCSIHHNSNGTGSFDSYTRGMGINISGSGALVENCTIVSNGNHGVYVQNGTIRNSLITGHDMTKSADYGGGVDQTGGNIFNCTIFGNSAKTVKYGDIRKTGGTTKNTIAYFVAVNDVVPDGGIDADHNLIGVDPLFKNQVKGDYHLRRNSPALNKGNNEAWDGLNGSVDLDGNPRISTWGNQVDIGCYETQPSPATIMILK